MTKLLDILIRLTALVFLATFPLGAAAQETSIGMGILCDTKAQLERVVSLANESRNLQASIIQVNGDTKACGVAHVMYVFGEIVGHLQTPDGPRDIARIYVIAGQVNGRWHPIQPQAQYTLFKAKGQPV